MSKKIGVRGSWKTFLTAFLKEAPPCPDPFIDVRPDGLLQKVLSEIQAENQQRLKDREQELKDLKKIMEVAKVGPHRWFLPQTSTEFFLSLGICGLLFFSSLQNSANKAHSDTETVLRELQESVERLQELLQEALDEASLEKMGQAQEVVDNLEVEIKERKKRDTEMKDLAGCDDHIYYLQVRHSRGKKMKT